MDYVGLSKNEIMIAMSGSGLIGLTRLIPSYLVDRCQCDKIKMTVLLMVLTGGATMVSVQFTTFPPLLIYFLLWGFLQCKLFLLKFARVWISFTC